MRTRILRVAELSQGDVLRWQALAERAIEPNAYLDPRWLHTSVLTHPDAADMMVALVEDDDDLRGLLAFTVEPAWQGFPFRAVSTAGRFLHTHAERHHPLIDPREPVATMESLLRGLRASRLPGLFALHKFVGDGPLAAALEQAVTRSGVFVQELLRQPWAFAESERPTLLPNSNVSEDGRLELTPEFMLPLSSKKATQNLRRRARGLLKELGAPVVLIDRSDSPEAISDFLTFQASGWKGDASAGGTAMALSEHTEKWFREVSERFGSDGDLRIFQVESGKTVLYMSVCYKSGGGVFGIIDSYNEDFGRYSVGHMGRILGLDMLNSRDPDTLFDPDLDPFYSSSTAIYPHRRERVNLLMSLGGPISPLLLRAVPLARRSRERVRELLRRKGGEDGPEEKSPSPQGKVPGGVS